MYWLLFITREWRSLVVATLCWFWVLWPSPFGTPLCVCISMYNTHWWLCYVILMYKVEYFVLICISHCGCVRIESESYQYQMLRTCADRSVCLDLTVTSPTDSCPRFYSQTVYVITAASPNITHFNVPEWNLPGMCQDNKENSSHCGSSRDRWAVFLGVEQLTR